MYMCQKLWKLVSNRQSCSRRCVFFVFVHLSQLLQSFWVFLQLMPTVCLLSDSGVIGQCEAHGTLGDF